MDAAVRDSDSLEKNAELPYGNGLFRILFLLVGVWFRFSFCQRLAPCVQELIMDALAPNRALKIGCYLVPRRQMDARQVNRNWTVRSILIGMLECSCGKP